MTTSAPARPADRSWLGDKGDLVLPIALVGILGLMIVPLPTLMLDILLAINISIALMVLLTAIQVGKPLDFSVFPSLLLITTLFRLALNVATTRLIMLHGNEGTKAAGAIVETFGLFVVGGSYVVGIIVFLILTLINFIVITKGAGRVAEVGARFTLDALPGKQMSIDSDLASGLMGQEEARARRSELARETDFYGAMDGASRFVRGDAIAGLVITAINIIGGLVIGTLQMGMTLGEAAETYTVLTIGDGLVGQIPALLISTSAGVVVTRAAESVDLGRQAAQQLLGNPKVLVAGAIILVALSLVPGMPTTIFLLIAAGLLLLARRGPQAPPRSGEPTAPASPAGPRPKPGAPTEEAAIEQMLPVEALQLDVGYGLVPLVDAKEGGEVVQRINRLRRKFAGDLGMILPPMHIRDSLDLSAGGYRLLVHGVEVAAGELMPDRILAMDPGDVRQPVDGVETVEPAFGLPALWVRAADRARAELAGYQVVEPPAVLITHISEVLLREAHKLLGREELQQLLDVAARRSPRVVDEVVPSILTHAELLAVLRALLRERVSIRDMGSILETVAESTRYGKGLPFLVDQVRQRLGPAIVQSLLAPDGSLHVAMLDAQTEDALRAVVVRNEAEVALAPDLATAQALLASVQEAATRLHDLGYPAVIVAPPDLRFALWRFAGRFVSQVHVVAQTELPPRAAVVTEQTIRLAARGDARGGSAGRR